MASACNNHKRLCSRHCSFVPLLLLLTLFVLCYKIACQQLTPLPIHFGGQVELSSQLTNLPTLVLACKDSHVSLNKLTCVELPKTSLCIIMLVASGDVGPNPGPINLSCMSCHEPVAATHRAMGCEKCDNWVHIKCCAVRCVLTRRLWRHMGMPIVRPGWCGA